jgi:3-phenylpropionate/cinnamic acid dioxygenase small subunit
MTMSLQEISDRMEIQDLLVAYSYAIDSSDWDALDDVFTPDAYIDYTVFGGSAGNLEETKKFLAEAMPTFRSFQHMVSTSRIEIDGDTAKVKTICHNPMVMPVGDDAVQVFYCGLWYVDDMVRTDAGWRIAKRVEEKSYVHNMPGVGDS